MNFNRSAFLGLLLSQAVAGAAMAGGVCPPGVPPQFGCGGKDLADITAGAYALDGQHAGLIASVSHVGYSFSIFRFDVVSGQLTWDPADHARSKLNVAVKTASITSNVAGFATELAGDNYLKSKTFPEATFVSTAFRQTDATHGEVDGQFTLMGRTRPVTFSVELIGAGKGFGHPRLGVHATAEIMPQDYGLPPVFDRPIKLTADVEFEKAS
ncbi:MAG TPA: YceI family protein [Phenylobacterium sp.]|nr:YceI family protein [Phenylobacterium sp.]